MYVCKYLYYFCNYGLLNVSKNITAKKDQEGQINVTIISKYLDSDIAT